MNDNKIGPVLFIGLGIVLFIFTVNGTIANLMKAASTGNPTNKDNSKSTATTGTLNVATPTITGSDILHQYFDSSGGSQTNFIAPGQQSGTSPTSTYVPNNNAWNEQLNAINNHVLAMNGVVTEQPGIYAA